MKTLLERLTWLRDIKNKSWEQMSKDAGLDPKHLAGYPARVIKKPGAGLTSSTLDKIAEAEGCNAEWLRTGKGEAGIAIGIPSHGSDPFPSRPSVVAYAHQRGVDPGAIAALLHEQRSDGRDPGVEYWGERLEFWIGCVKKMDERIAPQPKPLSILDQPRPSKARR